MQEKSARVGLSRSAPLSFLSMKLVLQFHLTFHYLCLILRLSFGKVSLHDGDKLH